MLSMVYIRDNERDTYFFFQAEDGIRDALINPTEAVRIILKQAPGEALCPACLAFSCSTSLTEMRKITTALVHDSKEFRNVSLTCASCRRLTATIVYPGPATE